MIILHAYINAVSADEAGEVLDYEAYQTGLDILERRTYRLDTHLTAIAIAEAMLRAHQGIVLAPSSIGPHVYHIEARLR